MKLIYIYHSCYVIEASGYAILIDYYKDTGEAPDRGYVHEELLRRPGKLYVMATHFHPDHFNKDILGWKDRKDDIVYLLSDDIRQYKKAGDGDAVFLEKGDVYTDENLTVRAFGSTDIGGSFLIETGGKKIFHAGDLNNWHWKDESAPEEIAVAERDYLNELELLAQTTEKLDLAMFPVDPRLGTDFNLGAKQFIGRIQTKVFAPMHFAEWYDKLIPFGKYAEARGIRFALWTGKGQSLEF